MKLLEFLKLKMKFGKYTSVTKLTGETINMPCKLKEFPILVKPRRALSSEWTVLNPILSKKELALETDTAMFKVGDGVTDWNSLPYDPETIPKSLLEGMNIYVRRY